LILLKKFYSILILLAAVLLPGCTRESIVPSAPVGVEFDVAIDGGDKASFDKDGQAAHVNRCILQIWNGDKIYKTIVKTAPAGTRHFNFKGVILDPEESYDFLFWADCGRESGEDLYYNSSSLKNVSLINPYAGNNDALDAFCNRVLDCHFDDKYEERLILRRPLAQLNIITEDIPSIASLPVAEQFAPESVSLTYYGCSAFDVYANVPVGSPVQYRTADLPVYGELSVSGVPSEKCTLAMIYVLPDVGSSASAVHLSTRCKNGTRIESDFEDVPLVSNYRTNVRGNILTVKGGFEIIVSPYFY